MSNTNTDLPILASIANLRDIAGHATRNGGCVRKGLLYYCTIGLCNLRELS
jgi:hypothetical protein